MQQHAQPSHYPGSTEGTPETLPWTVVVEYKQGQSVAAIDHAFDCDGTERATTC